MSYVANSLATMGIQNTNFVAYPTLASGAAQVELKAMDYATNWVTNTFAVTITNNGLAKTLMYDLNGNLTEYATPALTNLYEWDGADRLVKISRRAAGGQWNVTEFDYDGLGRRVRISETTNSSTTTKSFLWCGTELCEERNSGGGTVNRRFFGHGEQISTTDYVFTRDHLGSVREMINGGGSIQARYEFDPYGRRTKVSGASEADFGYTGHYYHQKSGLHLAPYREFDPEVGRWLKRDPFREHDGLNLYTYVHNDPINSVDPLGLSTSSALRAFGLGLAGSIVGAGVVAGLAIVATVGTGFIAAAAVVAAVGLVAYGGYQLGKTVFEIAMREEAYTGRTLCWDDWGDRLAGLSGGLAGGGLLGKAFAAPKASSATAENLPPGWTPEWVWNSGTRQGQSGWRWYDAHGGEWRYHRPDRSHSEGHWDYNPNTAWNSRWLNVDKDGNVLLFSSDR